MHRDSNLLTDMVHQRIKLDTYESMIMCRISKFLQFSWKKVISTGAASISYFVRSGPAKNDLPRHGHAICWNEFTDHDLAGTED